MTVKSCPISLTFAKKNKKKKQKKKGNSHINQFQLSIAFHIETSHLMCGTNQMTDFYTKCSTRLKCINGMTTSYHRFDL